MKFGFAHVPKGTPQESVELIALAEQLGFDWAWVPDQTFHDDPYPILTAAALATRTIGLAVGITNPYTRHPITSARAAATVNQFANGRLRFGLGAGNQRELIKPLGYAAEAPARAIREAMRLMRAFWSGEPVTLEGSDFQVRGVQMEIAAKADIPIYLGGRGPHILALAGQEADGMIFSLAGLDRAAALVAQGARQAGRDPQAIGYVAWGECAILDAESDLAPYRVRLAHVLGRAPETGLRVMGLADDEIVVLKQDFERGGPEAAAHHVTDELLGRHLIIGDQESCIAALRQLEAKGIESFVFLVKQAAFGEVQQALEDFSRLIITAY